jgi:hypothetical protein
LRYRGFLLWRKIKVMILALLAPEVLLALAWAKLVSAKEVQKELKSVAHADGAEWSLKHSYFADMGGFALSFRYLDGERDKQGQDGSKSSQPEDITERGNVKNDRSEQGKSDGNIAMVEEVENEHLPTLASQASPKDKWPRLRNKAFTETVQYFDLPRKTNLADRYISLSALESAWSKAPWGAGKVDWNVDHANLAILYKAMPTIRADILRTGYVYPYRDAVAMQGDIWFLDGEQLRLARECGIIAEIPNLTSEDLGDKDNGNSFVTLLAMTQILWLTLQLIVRTARRIPSTPLEVLTLSYSACSFLTYALNFDMPQDINTPVYVSAIRYPTATELCKISRGHTVRLADTISHTTLDVQAPLRLLAKPTPWIAIDSFNSRISGGNVGFGMLLGCLILGGVHCAAWNAHYPTAVERLLWRIASIATAGLPYVAVGLLMSLENRGVKAVRADQVAVVVMMAIYIMVRLYTLVESLRSLGYQPPEVFVSTWVASIPHVG